VKFVSEGIVANQQALKDQGNFKDFQDLILETFQKNVCFDILLQAAMEVDKVVGSIFTDAHIILEKQCKTSSHFEESLQEVMEELGNLSGYKEEWKKAVEDCKNNTLEEVGSRIHNAKSQLKRKAEDFFPQYEKSKSDSWKREYKASDKMGDYYRTRDKQNAEEIINEIIKQLSSVYQEEIQALMGSCVQTSLDNLKQAITSIQQTIEQIPAEVKKILRFDPPQLGSVRTTLTANLTITNLEEKASASQMASKKRAGYTARFISAMTFGYKKTGHGEFQIYPSGIVERMSSFSAETLTSISPNIESIISAECEKLLSGMIQGIERRETEVRNTFKKAEKPMSDIELREHFEMFKPYSMVHGNIQSIIAKCEERNLEVKANVFKTNQYGAFNPALWPKGKSKLEAFRSADADTKRSMLLEIEELPHMNFTTNEARDAAKVLAEALGEGDAELRMSAARATKEMLEGKTMHKAVLEIMVKALVTAMRDFNDVEIARILGKLLRDKETTFNTIRELILESFQSVLDSAAFTSDDLIESLEVMLELDLKSQLTGIAKGAAKDIVMGLLEKQIGQAGAKAAAKATEAIGASWPFCWCCAQKDESTELNIPSHSIFGVVPALSDHE
jgi:hypothetical protein